MTNFLKLTGSFGIKLYSLNMKFHEKIFTTIIIIQLWNFGNFGISEIIPKSLVTLRFSKISLHELKISCKTFQMRHWPNFYFDPAYSNTWLTCNATRFKTNAHDCKCLLGHQTLSWAAVKQYVVLFDFFLLPCCFQLLWGVKSALFSS